MLADKVDFDYFIKIRKSTLYEVSIAYDIEWI